MAENGTEQITPSTHLQVTLEALFNHLHTITVLRPLTLETISTAHTQARITGHKIVAFSLLVGFQWPKNNPCQLAVRNVWCEVAGQIQ